VGLPGGDAGRGDSAAGAAPRGATPPRRRARQGPRRRETALASYVPSVAT